MTKLISITALGFILLMSNCCYAQKVFSVQYANQADVKVFVVDYPNQADLKVYKVKYKNQTGWVNNAKKHLFC
jgi:hypothetical protein